LESEAFRLDTDFKIYDFVDLELGKLTEESAMDIHTISQHNLIRRAFLGYIEKCVEIEIRTTQNGKATQAQSEFLDKV
jgi:hypothetical protein